MNEQILKNTNAKLLDEFNASINFDKNLYSQDIKGSLAHSQMLFLQGILSEDEKNKIHKGLEQIKKDIENGNFEFKLEDEDIHMAIERNLTKIIGETAKKLHTARSRNDQVATDFKLYIKEKNISLMAQIKKLLFTFEQICKNHTETLLPGMTHLQHAQPINLAFHLLSYVNMFQRDFKRFESSNQRNDTCPLGSAALAGTAHNIDRFKTASLLGFKTPCANAQDGVSDRDFALEILFNISTLSMHISRISEELILWSSYEFDFIKISDEYATTSSIMPQKKNPDVPELLRGKSGRIYGNLFALLTVMKSLPLAYNKDTQEDKEGVFDSVKNIELCLSILDEILKTMQISKENMLKACKKGHLCATDFADYLVQKQNFAFRDAYYLAKDAVAKADSLNKDISDLSFEELKDSSPKLKSLASLNKEVLTCLDLRNSMNSRDSYGGTSSKQSKIQIQELKEWLEQN